MVKISRRSFILTGFINADTATSGISLNNISDAVSQQSNHNGFSTDLILDQVEPIVDDDDINLLLKINNSSGLDKVILQISRSADFNDVNNLADICELKKNVEIISISLLNLDSGPYFVRALQSKGSLKLTSETLRVVKSKKDRQELVGTFNDIKMWAFHGEYASFAAHPDYVVVSYRRRSDAFYQCYADAPPGSYKLKIGITLLDSGSISLTDVAGGDHHLCNFKEDGIYTIEYDKTVGDRIYLNFHPTKDEGKFQVTEISIKPTW